METHDIHGIKVDFHSGTGHMVSTLRSMPKEEALKFLNGAKGHDKYYFGDSRIKHEERDGEDHFSFHPHNS